ncbi:hypothetical protein BV20DRAFT_946891 [Pilatotrama ljubarskyi]|nr:hypothetical protein BV20DRAFT_946891 [Pilatotrama ljubarskyi]
MAFTYTVRPRFPPVGLPPQPFPCPKVGRPASALTKKICYYIHEYILVPFSMWYMHHYKIESPTCMFALPFGLILKRHVRVHEQEGLAMNLARAMGIPAPRCISFGSLGLAERKHYTVCDSLLMTRVPGRPLDSFNNDEVDWDVFVADLTRILTRMRSFSSPFGDAVCGAAGGEIRDLPVLGQPRRGLPVDDRADAPVRPHHDVLRIEVTVREDYGMARDPEEIGLEHLLPCPASLEQLSDLFRRTLLEFVLVREAGKRRRRHHRSSVTALLPTLPWGRFMGDVLTDGIYADEIRGHQELIHFVELNGSYW